MLRPLRPLGKAQLQCLAPLTALQELLLDEHDRDYEKGVFEPLAELIALKVLGLGGRKLASEGCLRHLEGLPLTCLRLPRNIRSPDQLPSCLRAAFLEGRRQQFPVV